MIKARAYTDDQIAQAEFDATAMNTKMKSWFMQMHANKEYKRGNKATAARITEKAVELSTGKTAEALKERAGCYRNGAA